MFIDDCSQLWDNTWVIVPSFLLLQMWLLIVALRGFRQIIIRGAFIVSQQQSIPKISEKNFFDGKRKRTRTLAILLAEARSHRIKMLRISSHFERKRSSSSLVGRWSSPITPPPPTTHPTPTHPSSTTKRDKQEQKQNHLCKYFSATDAEQPNKAKKLLDILGPDEDVDSAEACLNLGQRLCSTSACVQTKTLFLKGWHCWL